MSEAELAGWREMPLGGEGYFDGTDWWVEETHEQMVEGRPPMEGGIIALHVVLTLLTVWACGGWLWVFLIHLSVAQRQPSRTMAVPTGRYLPVNADGSRRTATTFPVIPSPNRPSVTPAGTPMFEPWMWWLVGGGAALTAIAVAIGLILRAMSG